MKLKENLRFARSPVDDPFDQQQQDVSAFILKGNSFALQQKEEVPFLKDDREYNDSENDPNRDIEEIRPETFRAGRARIPIYPPISLHDDTLVNDLLLNDVRNG